MPVEQHARVTRVLAQDHVSRAQLFEDAQGDVVQVPDRRRADRESHLPDRVKRNKTGADQPGGGPELCPKNRDLVASPSEGLAAHDFTRRVEHEIAGGREPAADHDELGIEDVHERPDSGPEMPADPVQDLDRPLLTFVRQTDEPVRIDRRPEFRLGKLGRGDTRDVGLEVSTARARSLTRNAVVDDDHVTELGPAAEELPVHDRAAAAAGSERQHHHRLDVAGSAEFELGVRGRICIVLDPDRQAEPLPHPPAKVDALAKWDVDRLQRAAGLLVDRRRQPEAEARDVVGAELLDRSIEPGEQLVLRAGRSRGLPAPLHLSPVVDDPGQDLGTAEIDADDTFSVQSARLPYFLDGDGREALPRLPGRTREGQGAAGPAAEGAGPQRPRAARAAAEGAGPQRTRPARAEDPQAPAAVELETADRHRPDRAPRRRHGLGHRRVPVLQEWSRQGERATRSVGDAGARQAERAVAVEADDDAAARPGPREHRPARWAEPFRLDHGPAHGSEPSPARLSVDPARSAPSHPGPW